jgi:hypothetical protein
VEYKLLIQTPRHHHLHNTKKNIYKMKNSLTATMVLFSALSLVAFATEAITRSSAIYGYCMGCTEWKTYVKNDNFLPAAAETTTSAAAFRSDFMPWPTIATRRLVPATAVDPISKEENLKEEKNHFLDFNTPNIMPLVRTKSLVSSNLTPQEEHLSESDLSQQQYEDQSFLLLVFLLVAAIGCAEGCREKGNKLSTSSDNNCVDMLELAPTIDDDEEQEDIPEVGTMETKSILVGSISGEGECILEKAEKRVQFQDMPQEEESKSQRTFFFPPKQSKGCTIPTPYDDCKSSMSFRYTCSNNSFQDRVSVEIIMFLLEDRVEKYDKSMAMPYFPFAAAVKGEEEEQSQDDVADVPSITTTKDSDQDESSAVSTMINDYDDFLFQVSHSFH